MYIYIMSEAEGNAMSSRILRTIERIINTDPNLQEFAIIPTVENTKNKSPILYEQHNIGLESWCIKHVYQYACTSLFDYREQLSRKKIPFCKMGDLNHLLMGAILINPDVGTFWNMRKELIEMDMLHMENELYFSKIVLTHKSKSNEAFSYRRWLLKRIVKKMANHHLEIPFSLLQNEFVVANSASEKSPNNYHSWNHRIWCMENIGCKSPNIQNILYSELSYSQEWVNNHVSEHSGYHYRQYLIKLTTRNEKISSVFGSYYNFVINELLNTINDGEYNNLLLYLLGKSDEMKSTSEICSFVNYISLLLYDFCVLVEKLNALFPEHESLFCHRKFLIWHLLKVPSEFHHDSSPKIANSVECIGSDFNSSRWPKLLKVSSTKGVSCKLAELVANRDKQFVAGNCSTIQVEKYRKWLTQVVGYE